MLALYYFINESGHKINDLQYITSITYVPIKNLNQIETAYSKKIVNLFKLLHLVCPCLLIK